MSTEDDIPVPAPYVPSELEARNYYYGLESRPRLIARSSPNVWKKPTGPEAFMEPKELTPLGMHPLDSGHILGEDCRSGHGSLFSREGS